MRLDRNITSPRRGKYALIKLRVASPQRVRQLPPTGPKQEWVAVPEKAVDYGDSVETDFFVIRLRDKYAAPALAAYAGAAMRDDPEYAREVAELANCAARMSKQFKPT